MEVVGEARPIDGDNVVEGTGRGDRPTGGDDVCTESGGSVSTTRGASVFEGEGGTAWSTVGGAVSITLVMDEVSAGAGVRAANCTGVGWMAPRVAFGGG